MKKFLLAGCVIAALVFTGCPQDDDSSGTTPTPTEGTVTLAVNVGTLGSDGKYTATVGPNEKVKLTANPADAVITYTLGTGDPATAYPEAGIPITATSTLRAVAKKTGWTDSAVLEAVYTVDNTVPSTVAEPEGIPNGSTVAGGEKITFTVPPDATIWYTTDGSDPSDTTNPNRKKYTDAGIEVAFGSGTEYILKTVVEKDGKTSPVSTLTYVKAEVAYTVEQADGEDVIATTTGLKFTFTPAVSDLKNADITVAGGTGEGGGAITKGSGEPTGGGTEWTLPVTVTKQGTVTVKVTKSGVESVAKTVTVFVKVLDSVTYYNAQADGAEDAEGNGTVTTRNITLTFTGPDSAEATAGLTAGDITVPGAEKGELSEPAVTNDENDPSKNTVVYELALTSITEPGEKTVTVTKPGVKPGETTAVTLYKDVTPPPAATGLNAAGGEKKVELTWTDPAWPADAGYPSDIKNLVVTWTLKATDEQPAPEVIDTAEVELGVGKHTVTGLAAGTVYTFTVTAVDNDGNKSAPATKDATTNVPAKPGVTPGGLPQNEAPVFSYVQNGGSATVTAPATLAWKFTSGDTLKVTVSAPQGTTYTAYAWYLNGEQVLDEEDDPITANNVTLTAGPGGLGPKNHTLTVVVTKGDVEYSVEAATFTVAK